MHKSVLLISTLLFTQASFSIQKTGKMIKCSSAVSDVSAFSDRLKQTWQKPIPLRKIVNGGQTGVDRASLDVALELGFDYGGWCPKGRLAEDGVIDKKYNLIETPSEVVAQRTEWNLRDSDGTVILTWGPVVAGTLLNFEYSVKYGNKPIYIIDMLDPIIDLDGFYQWLVEKNISVLNVSGPRQSLRPEVYPETAALIKKVFTTILQQNNPRFSP